MQKVEVCLSGISWGFLKKRLEATLHSDLANLEQDDFKLNTFNTTDTKSESVTFL